MTLCFWFAVLFAASLLDVTPFATSRDARWFTLWRKENSP